MRPLKLPAVVLPTEPIQYPEGWGPPGGIEIYSALPREMRLPFQHHLKRPGRLGWDHAWPDRHAWPVSPWGKGDPQDDCWRDYAAFEKWFTDECERREIDLDIDLTERISIYALLCDIFAAGVLAGRDPWRWAEELQRITPPQES